MNLQPKIQILDEKKLVGIHLTMSLAENRTYELWRAFMPRRNEICNRVYSDFISLNVYNETLKLGDFYQKFEKWATVEVTDFSKIPDKMTPFVLRGGLYAVFNYKGNPADSAIFSYIFATWLPQSEYFLDNRPHFEILGDNYKNNDPNSEEEIWIPIIKKK